MSNSSIICQIIYNRYLIKILLVYIFTILLHHVLITFSLFSVSGKLVKHGFLCLIYYFQGYYTSMRFVQIIVKRMYYTFSLNDQQLLKWKNNDHISNTKFYSLGKEVRLVDLWWLLHCLGHGPTFPWLKKKNNDHQSQVFSLYCIVS